LGGGVLGGAVGGRRGGGGRAGDAEVDELDRIGADEHEVAGFDVAVQVTGAVDRGQGLGGEGAAAGGLGGGEGPVAAQMLTEVGALGELEDEGHDGVGGDEVAHADDAGVVDGG